ncbi:MAG: TlpA disulfide reductase family protein [Clostridia bacterium]|nr:TlpA disulfide reductase family protein [Clostridia bacterium]
MVKIRLKPIARIAIVGLLLGATMGALGFGFPSKWAKQKPGKYTENGQIQASPSPGYRAPDFEWVLASGARMSLRGLAGKVIVLTFFQTKSGASLAQLSAMEQLAVEQLAMETQGSGSCLALGVAAFERDDVVCSFIASHSLHTMPVAADPSGRITDLYEVTAVPTTFVIDRDGIVSDLRVGSMTYAELSRAIKRASGTGP